MSLREKKKSKYGGHRAPNGKFFLHKAIQGYSGCHPNLTHSVPEFFSLRVQQVPAFLSISTTFQNSHRRCCAMTKMTGETLYFHQEKNWFVACSHFSPASFQYSVFSPNSAFWKDNSEKNRFKVMETFSSWTLFWTFYNSKNSKKLN